MSDLINRLAVQAGFEFNNQESSSREDLNKFAQLIVDECVNTLQQAWYEENNKEPEDVPRAIGLHVGRKSALQTSMILIRKKFGVEQNERTA